MKNEVGTDQKEIQTIEPQQINRRDFIKKFGFAGGLTLFATFFLPRQVRAAVLDNLSDAAGVGYSPKGVSTHATNVQDALGDLESGLQVVNGNLVNISADMSGKAESEHKHTTSDISDFPKALPASDVPDWAKNPKKPSYTAKEVGAADALHTHSGYAAANHTHNGYAAADHNHDTSYYTKTEMDQKLGTQVTFTVSGSTLIITSK